MNKPFFSFLATLGVFFFCSCGQPVPEPEPTPTPPADVTLTLGETTKLTAAALFGEDLAKKLTRGEGDAYSFDFSGDAIEFVVNPLAGYDGTKMFSRLVNTPLTTSFTLAKKPAVTGNGEIDLSSLLPSLLDGGSLSADYTFSFGGFPASLTELQGVNLTSDSYFDVQVSVATPCFTAGTLTPTFTVDLTSLFGVREAGEDGILTFDVELTHENGYSAVKTFHPETFTVKSENYNPLMLNVSSDLSASARVVATHAGLKTTKSRLSAASAPFKLKIAVTLKKVAIASIAGTFKCDTKAVTSSVNLSALGETIGGTDRTLEDFGLTPAASKIALDVESLFPVETETALSITAKKSKAVFGSVNGLPLVFPAKTESGAAKVRYDLSKSENLSPLLTKVATEMAFTVGAKGKEIAGTFLVNEPAQATIVPSVSVPLCFGSGLSYMAEQRLDLSQAIVAALKGGRLTLLGTITNTFPVSLTASVVLVDAAGQAVSETISQAVPAEGSSDVQLSFKPKSGSSLENAKTAVIQYSLKGVDNSRPLKATDYIQANLNAKISYQ